MRCDGCGAPLRLEEGKDYLVCDFCGSTHAPPPDDDGIRVLGDASPLACPVCRVALVHAAVGGERFLACKRCGGFLLAGDVFSNAIAELRARRSGLGAVQTATDLKSLDRRIECPECGGAMDTHPYGGPGNIVIDNCEGCGLIWLDRGELLRVVSAPDWEA